MSDERDIPTLTLAILRDIRDDLRGMREEQREANARSERNGRNLEQRMRVLDIRTELRNLDPRIERARETNARIEQFLRGVDQKSDDELRARVEKLEAHVFGTRTP